MSRFLARDRQDAIEECERVLHPIITYGEFLSFREDCAAYNARQCHGALVTLLCKGVAS